MATKRELETDYERCEQIRRGAASAVAAHDYPQAVRQAESALPHLHAAVRFQRLHLKAAPIVPVLEVIFRYAPPLFLARSLDAVEAWYAGGTRGEKAALSDLPERLATARSRLARAVELWSAFAGADGTLSAPVDKVGADLLRVWTSAGLVAPHPTIPKRFTRITDVRRPAAGKCAGCGKERVAPLADLLDPSTCPACGRRCVFVLTRRVFGGPIS